MSKKFKPNNDEPKRRYESPVFDEETGMTFARDVWKEFNGNKWCFGCTNCNCN